ncbi:MAG: hypothetical protein ACOX3U_05165 [Christensenellales bacterium]|jgi:hypothetical protein
MKYILYFLFYLIQFTWGIIQNLLGLILFIRYKGKREFFFGSVITYHNENWGGISLGIFITISSVKGPEWIAATKVHEYGHTIQSLILGPLYLFIIGIPSIIWCNAKKFKALRKERNISYFDFYPEKWANRLGARISGLKAPE